MELSQTLKLSREPMIKIITLLAAESPKYLGSIKLSCKELNELSWEGKVLESLNLKRLMMSPRFLSNQVISLIHRCYEEGNIDAYFILGCHAIFVHGQIISGMRRLVRSYDRGYLSSGYALGIAMLHCGNRAGLDFLLSILRQEDGKGKIRNCRIAFNHVTLGVDLKFSPTQSCYMEGKGHWFRDLPCPYGEEEFFITCLDCSVDLDLYKLVNRLW